MARRTASRPPTMPPIAAADSRPAPPLSPPPPPAVPTLRLPVGVDVRGRSADVHNIEARQTRLLLHPCMLWRHSAAAMCCTGLMVRHHNAACWGQAAAAASPSFVSQSNTGRSCHHLLRHLAGGVRRMWVCLQWRPARWHDSAYCARRVGVRACDAEMRQCGAFAISSYTL